MALKIVNGDLLHSTEVDVIIHQCNCQRTMGKGIAKEIKSMFPSAYRADQEFSPVAPEARLGRISYVFCTHPIHGRPVLIVNLYGQLEYWKSGKPRGEVFTDYAALESGLQEMFDGPIRQFTEEYGLVSPVIGVPYLIGCGLANGDVATVSRILNEVSIRNEADIVAYKMS